MPKDLIARVERRNLDILLLAVVIGIFLIGGLAAFRAHSVLSPLESDGTEFLFDAKRLLSGQGYNSDFWPFGYMIVIACVHAVFKLGFFEAAKAVSLASAAGVLIGTYLICRVSFSRYLALAAVCILASNRTFLQHSVIVETDMLFAMLFVFAVYLLVRNDQIHSYLLAGMAAGLTYMVKYGASAFFPVVAILWATKIRSEGFLRSGKRFLAFTAAFVLFSSPWLIYNTIKNGSPLYSKHTVNIAWAINRPRLTPPEYWHEYFQLNEKYKSLADIVREPGKLLTNWGLNIAELPKTIRQVMPWAGLLVLPAYAMVILGSRSRPRFVLILISCSFLALMTMAYCWPRYLLPLVPIFAVMSAHLVFSVTEFCTGLIAGKHKSLIGPAIIAVLVLVSVQKTVTRMDKFTESQLVAGKAAGEWLARRIKKDEWVMVPRPQIAWYAGTDRFVNYPLDKTMPIGEAVKLREQTPFFFIQEGLSRRIRTHIDYVVYSEDAVMLKNYRFLIHPASPDIPDSFEPIYSTPGEGGATIYRVKHE